MSPCMWLLIAVVVSTDIDAIKVIGGNRTAVQGQNVSLPCRLTETVEDLSQISWQKQTKENPVNHNFFIISPKDGPHHVNGVDRFSFIGSIKDNNGSLQLSHVRLLDEGIYTCIFTLFPSGAHKTGIRLTVHVPPATSLEVEDHPVLGDKEVTFASCVAAGAKPPAQMSWHTGSLAESVRTVTNSTQHANGTTTTVSSLVGVPTREVNHHLVQCVVTHDALTTEETLPFTIEVYFSPMSLNIREVSKDVLECVSDGNPNASYTWSRVSQPVPQTAVGAEGGRLQLISLTADLSGLYRCEASNPYGRTFGYAYVHLTSGACTTCWTLFIITLILMAVGAGIAIWFWHKYKYLPRKEDGKLAEQHHPLSSQSHQRVEEEKGEGEEEEGQTCKIFSYLFGCFVVCFISPKS
ncbi:nectin-3-like protein isoform X2 [Centroberyx affinis]|uniref:nectin-3-like protein isoform X2 n=2 Tax=Centroberyx affinis TaxID=166261 RepID=UPI003A5C41BE